MVHEPLPQPSQKPKRKRKRKNDEERGLWPYFIAAGLLVVVLVGAGVAIIVTRPDEPDCATEDPSCGTWTPSPVPYSLFPTATMPPMMPVGEDQPRLTAFALTPDESQFIAGVIFPMMSASNMGQLQTIDIDQTSPQRIIPAYPELLLDLSRTPLTQVNQIVFHPQMERVALASIVDERVEVVDTHFAFVDGGSSLGLDYPGYTQAAYSPSGAYFAIAGRDNVQLYDATGQELLAESGLVGQPLALRMAFNSDSTLLVVGRVNVEPGNLTALVRVWDVSDGQLTEVTTYTGNRNMLDMAMHPQRNQLAWVDALQLTLVDLDTQEQTTYPLPIGGHYNAVAYHPDATALVVAGSMGDSGVAYEIPLQDGLPEFEEEEGVVRARQFGQSTADPVLDVAYTSQGTPITGTIHGAIHVWPQSEAQPYYVRRFAYEG